MIQQGATNAFKVSLLNGGQNFTSGVYKIALYRAIADLGPNTTVYTAAGEVAGGINYAAVATAILQAALSAEPGRTLFRLTTVGGRPLGDITGNGTVTSADPLAYTKWAEGTNTDAAQVAWIEGTVNPYILANPVTYAAYLLSNGYTAGGNTLVNVVPASSDGVAFISFLNTTWDPASFTARGALIYNSTTGAAVAVLDFGSDKTASNTFTVTFPTATASDAIIRLS
jgi:hypothetical protein